MQYPPAFAGVSACALALLATGSISAQSIAADGDVRIIRMTPDQIEQQTRVVTRDLDLATPEGRSVLRRRVASAARLVCRVPERAAGRAEEWDKDGCVEHAHRTSINTARHEEGSVGLTRR